MLICKETSDHIWTISVLRQLKLQSQLQLHPILVLHSPFLQVPININTLVRLARHHHLPHRTSISVHPSPPAPATTAHSSGTDAPSPTWPNRLRRRQNPKAALLPSPPPGRPTSPSPFSSKPAGIREEESSGGAGKGEGAGAALLWQRDAGSAGRIGAPLL